MSNNSNVPSRVEELNTILARVFEIAADTITDDSSPKTVPTWDSYNALMLVSELEKEFNVSFTLDEVVAVQCVGDIKEALRRHGVSV